MKTIPYTYEEIKQVIDGLVAGEANGVIGKRINRKATAIQTTVYQYKKFMRGEPVQTNSLLKHFEQYKQNTEGKKQATNGTAHQYKPVQISTSTRENDLATLEDAFNRLQTVIVDVIEHEAQRRSEAEVKKYKELYEEKEQKLGELISQMKESNLAAQLRKRFGMFSS